MESKHTLTQRGKSPLPEKNSSEDQTHASSSMTMSPTHYQQAIPAPDSPYQSSDCDGSVQEGCDMSAGPHPDQTTTVHTVC